MDLSFNGFLVTVLLILFLVLVSLAVLTQRRKRKRIEEIRELIPIKLPYKDEDIDYTVFFIGDMGAISSQTKDPVLHLLECQLCDSREKSAAIFLGDNIYPKGMPPENDLTRKQAEDRIMAQLNILRDYPGKIFMISGNHDWNKGKEGGWDHVLRQEKYVEKYLGRNIFLPDHGCPGPVEIDLTDKIRLIIINTQWWVQKGAKPIGEKDGCIAKNEKHFFSLLQEAIGRSAGKDLIIGGHHPLYSNAMHGGKFSFRQHVFPLTDMKRRLYVPLPGVGSLYPLYRKVYGTKEDMSYPAYRSLRKKLLAIFKSFPGLIYAAGHDHNLQHIIKNHQHYLISGSGSKIAFVKKGGKAAFAESKRGFMKAVFLSSGEKWLEAWTYDDKEDKSRLSYYSKL